MPPKTQLKQADIDNIISRVNEVNALRTLSKEFLIGQGRIRRIWGQSGVSYREAYTKAPKIGVPLTTELMKGMMGLATKLESDVKPWPATHDQLRGLPPQLTDEEQVERYLASLTIAHEASLINHEGFRPIADSHYNAIMKNAFELLPKSLYRVFTAGREVRKIYR
jgi:hypothetical protein